MKTLLFKKKNQNKTKQNAFIFLSRSKLAINVGVYLEGDDGKPLPQLYTLVLLIFILKALSFSFVCSA